MGADAEHHGGPFMIKQDPASVSGGSPGAAIPAGKCCLSLRHALLESADGSIVGFPKPQPEK